MRRITIRITGLSGNLGEDDGTEEPYWRPLIMWVETFWSIDLSDIALKGCMDNFAQYTRRSCLLPVHLRERSITQHTNSKQQSLCHKRYCSS